jgi:hypothetical protein
MNKDSDLKNDPSYHSGSLRERINKAIKGTRDLTEEVKNPQVKSMSLIPVTGSDNQKHKYFENKSLKKH